jgi:hypothetical protein
VTRTGVGRQLITAAPPLEGRSQIYPGSEKWVRPVPTGVQSRGSQERGGQSEPEVCRLALVHE